MCASASTNTQYSQPMFDKMVDIYLWMSNKKHHSLFSCSSEGAGLILQAKLCILMFIFSSFKDYI